MEKQDKKQTESTPETRSWLSEERKRDIARCKEALAAQPPLSPEEIHRLVEASYVVSKNPKK